MTTIDRLCLSFVAPDAATQASGGLAVRFRCGGYDRIVHFAAQGATLAANGDALLCLGLVPAMELGVDLYIEAEVDRELLDNTRDIQALLCEWYPGYRTVAVDTGPIIHRTYPEGRGTGLFFSGGVDSSYSLATERDRITSLVTLIGADVALTDAPRVARLEALAKDVAARFGVGYILVTTDIRSVSDRLIGWVEYHGAVLAAVRHMLAHAFENQLIASSGDDSAWTFRWGSHPALDHLWGTGGARIEHHGLEHRLAKVQRISREPALMDHLRVCNRRFEHCGTCRSCQFMLAALDLVDMRTGAPTYRHLASTSGPLQVTGPGTLSEMRYMRSVAAGGGHAAIAAAADRAIRRYHVKKFLTRIVPLDEIARRFKRFKRQRRFIRQVERPIR
ncbi:hypothetical protein EJC49_21090 [Aquibium carbonis]|uniref:Uncharacterized protein n=1 Tax=Aquibium carbonis TaxID=2495581 RepID=A0A3R9Y524_9HYPH|nr:hypothetical protein [Aquibium carbonis]RST84430.1 hypothetical protein EJC49_21090 [Aquibium carbonis]